MEIQYSRNSLDLISTGSNLPTYHRDLSDIRSVDKMAVTATTVWLLLLITETGLTSLQSVHTSPEACEAARETYRASPYYTVTCQAKERLR